MSQASPEQASVAAFDRAQTLLQQRRMDDAIDALRESVALNPGLAMGWLYLGGALLAAGDQNGLESLYIAFAMNPQLEQLPQSPQAQPAIRQTTAQGLKAIRGKFVDLQRASVDELRAQFGGEAMQRIDACLRMQHGQEKPVYGHPLQRPDTLYFPGLEPRPWFERNEFEWVGQVEASFEAIRGELDTVIEAQGYGAYTPYVAPGSHVPESMQDLAGSLDWQAFHLYASGEKRLLNCERCPVTCETIERLPMPVCKGSAPEVFFSFLKPHTHIKPHHGVANTKLAVHLPLVVPQQCEIRVGDETRGWTESECLIFDDSFEHEAWNRGDQLRVVLIFEVWNPCLSKAETEALTRIFAAVDDWADSIRPQYKAAFDMIESSTTRPA